VGVFVFHGVDSSFGIGINSVAFFAWRLSSNAASSSHCGVMG
jgi:hypothetical protein